jgi:hypothetical protein
MPLPYVPAVISFCHGQAHRILTIVSIELWTRRWSFGVPMADVPDPLDWSPSEEDASGWLERTPVMIALRRREDRLTRAELHCLDARRAPPSSTIRCSS